VLGTAFSEYLALIGSS